MPWQKWTIMPPPLYCIAPQPSQSQSTESLPGICGVWSYWSCLVSWMSATSILQRFRTSAYLWISFDKESQLHCRTRSSWWVCRGVNKTANGGIGYYINWLPVNAGLATSDVPLAQSFKSITCYGSALKLKYVMLIIVIDGWEGMEVVGREHAGHSQEWLAARQDIPEYFQRARWEQC